MNALQNEALERFLNHLTNSPGSSYLFVDVHVSADSSGQVVSASKTKITQYNQAWDHFRQRLVSRNPDKYRHLLTRYEQINHTRKGQPQVYAFGINYDGYLDNHARDFMHHLACIKYPMDPNNRSYKPSRAR